MHIFTNSVSLTVDCGLTITPTPSEQFDRQSIEIT
jgi:hypothetical protein